MPLNMKRIKPKTIKMQLVPRFAPRACQFALGEVHIVSRISAKYFRYLLTLQAAYGEQDYLFL